MDHEDEDVLAFLDLFPQSYGHCLVIPKNAPARNILEIDDANLAKVMTVVRKLTQAVVDELEPAGVQVAASGQSASAASASLGPSTFQSIPLPLCVTGTRV